MSPKPPPRFILIHGAWQGAWAWDALMRELDLRRLDAVALDLPGNGHHAIPAEAVEETDYHSALSNAIDAAPGQVILIGHSGGGMMVTAAAEVHAERVMAAVYLAGMLLPESRDFAAVQREVVPETGMFGVTPYIETSSDGVTCVVPINAAIRHFYHDLPIGFAKEAARKLTPQPLVGHRLRVATTARFAAIPKIYIEATDDRSIPIEAQRLMQSFATGVRVISMQTGHAPQLAAPAVLADHLAALTVAFQTAKE